MKYTSATPYVHVMPKKANYEIQVHANLKDMSVL